VYCVNVDSILGLESRGADVGDRIDSPTCRRVRTCFSSFVRQSVRLIHILIADKKEQSARRPKSVHWCYRNRFWFISVEKVQAEAPQLRWGRAPRPGLYTCPSWLP
jgi:hypothetical protein